MAEHNTEEDCWIAHDGSVYDVTKFLQGAACCLVVEHPSHVP